MKDTIDAIVLALLGPRPPWGDYDLPTFAHQTVLEEEAVAGMPAPSVWNQESHV